MASFNIFMQKAVISLIVLYRQCVSPFLRPRCRFSPSCSDYAIMAIRLHGLLKGGYLSVKRLMRCHPLGGSGVDEVPQARHRHN